MAMWLYQLSQQKWPPKQYRADIWEGERWRWAANRIVASGGQRPDPGDVVVFCYARTGGDEPGVYGWAVILGWHADDNEISFRSVAPSDVLKMAPWSDDVLDRWMDQVRGGNPQGTLWLVDNPSIARKIRWGIVSAVYGSPSPCSGANELYKQE